ncbi:GNAT family N-acetyltransferase [Rhizobium sp. C4]|uniref:GNAT family N-acetyltransferase n=1 Tax=Rhizobium sp. C4 TaxID=1349800 RepID=UPI001E39B415|nr:GNAT family N-acetyltransferase [Rhizobium sp. C4]MCD2171626.1 GNAT family N-acetyltransferase [Rhizobium sp. C4]
MRTAPADLMVSPANKDVLTRMNAIPMEAAASQARPAPDICVYHSFEPVEQEWRMLEAGRHVSLHQSLTWCKAWAANMSPELAIVVGRMRGRTVFILPLEIVSTDLGRIARFIGARHSNLNTGLFNESFALGLSKADLKAIFSSIRQQMAGRADLIQLTNMPQTWRGVPVPWLYPGGIENQNKAYQLPLRPTMDETLEQIHAKRKRKLYRKSIRQFEAAGGYDHVTAETPEEKDALLTAFFRQKAQRLQAMHLPNPFREDNVQAFFRDAAHSSQEAPNTALSLHALRMKDDDRTIVAIAGLSRKGDHVICQFGSVEDDIVPGASPGEFLYYLIIEEACANRVALFDFGIGYQLYKKSWCPVETQHYDVMIPVSLRGRIGASAISAATRLKAAIKRNRPLYALIQRLRADKQGSPAPDQDD